jgi:hypothetical protein
MPVWLSKMILAQHFLHGLPRHSLITPAIDWLDSLIGPAGLLLVVSHLFAIPVLVLWVGLEKCKQLKLGCENFFAGSHSEHCLRWSKILKNMMMISQFQYCLK